MRLFTKLLIFALLAIGLTKKADESVLSLQARRTESTTAIKTLVKDVNTECVTGNKEIEKSKSLFNAKSAESRAKMKTLKDSSMQNMTKKFNQAKLAAKDTNKPEPVFKCLDSTNQIYQDKIIQSSVKLDEEFVGQQKSAQESFTDVNKIIAEFRKTTPEKHTSADAELKSCEDDVCLTRTTAKYTNDLNGIKLKVKRSGELGGIIVDGFTKKIETMMNTFSLQIAKLEKEADGDIAKCKLLKKI